MFNLFSEEVNLKASVVKSLKIVTLKGPPEKILLGSQDPQDLPDERDLLIME